MPLMKCQSNGLTDAADFYQDLVVPKGRLVSFFVFKNVGRPISAVDGGFHESPSSESKRTLQDDSRGWIAFWRTRE